MAYFTAGNPYPLIGGVDWDVPAFPASAGQFNEGAERVVDFTQDGATVYGRVVRGVSLGNGVNFFMTITNAASVFGVLFFGFSTGSTQFFTNNGGITFSYGQASIRIRADSSAFANAEFEFTVCYTK